MSEEIAIHLPSELRAALTAEAERAGMSVHALAEEAIARHLEARRALAHVELIKRLFLGSISPPLAE